MLNRKVIFGAGLVGSCEWKGEDGRRLFVCSCQDSLASVATLFAQEGATNWDTCLRMSRSTAANRKLRIVQAERSVGRERRLQSSVRRWLKDGCRNE